MRLHEFFKHPIDLHEVLNTVIPDVDWKNTPEGHEANVKIGEYDYRIQSQNAIFKIGDEEYPYLNVAFQRFKDEQYVTYTTHDTKQSSKVIGAIGNSIGMFVEKTKPTAILFGSTDTDNSGARMRIYSAIASRYLNDYGRTKTFKMSQGEAIVVYNPQLGAKIMPFMAYIQQQQYLK
jgi:hypothetical protein